MKNLYTLLFGVLTLLTFTHCGSSQILETMAPFSLEDPAVEPWTAGANHQYTGVNLFFPVTEGRSFTLDSVYYGNKGAALEKIQKDNYLVYKGTIETTEEDYDFVMHADPRKEVGNRPPSLKKSPFELEEGVAVISYLDKGERRYFKIDSLQMSTAIHYEKKPSVKNRR